MPAEGTDTHPETPPQPPHPRRVAVVLAAGQGTRMKSALPKVLHRAGGRPMLAWVVDAAREAGCDRILVVIGHGADRVRQELAAPDVEFVLQAEQRGTGHALAQAGPLLRGPGADGEATVLVLSGDVPLITAETLRGLAEAAEQGTGDQEGWGALAVAEVDDPGSYGRVVAEDGRLVKIVEFKDASEAERRITTVNAGLYAFPAPEVFDYLDRVEPNNAQGEIYLTDVPGLAVADGRAVVLAPLRDASEAQGVNTRSELARAHRLLMDRHLERLLAAGVTVLEPARTTLEPTVRVGRDTVIHPDVALHGATVVGAGCELHQGAWLRDARLGDGVVVEPYTVLDGAAVADGGRVGPFARLRPGAELAAGAKAGNFVEIKNARLGEGAKANHLAYVGDAEVGAGANVGAGVVTCNYDGRAKHRTVIGPGAFVGSDTMLVAPVEVGEGASTAAGSVITQDVPPGALGVSRARQRNVEGWRDRRRRSEE